jgi:hypothetical protein
MRSSHVHCNWSYLLLEFSGFVLRQRESIVEAAYTVDKYRNTSKIQFPQVLLAPYYDSDPVQRWLIQQRLKMLDRLLCQVQPELLLDLDV